MCKGNNIDNTRELTYKEQGMSNKTLGMLLEEIKHGKEFIDSKETVTDLQDILDEDYNILLVSKRANQLLKECDSSQPFIKKLVRASRNYKDYEDKILEGSTPSEIYAKMKSDSIIEDVNSSIDLLNNRKVLRESNQENIAKTIAILKYGLKSISEEKNVILKKVNELPQLIEAYVSKETLLIESVV